MSSSSSKKGQPSFDPYDVLGVALGASDAEITKAYRKLALQLHPDKQKAGSLTAHQVEEVAKRFHDIKEARSFLLDSEHAEDRRAFDAKRESDRIRRETEVIREQQMSASRKRMREELLEKEAKAQSSRRKQQRKEKDEKDVIDKLRQEGLQRREEQANRNVEKEVQEQLRKDRKERQSILEERQIRLKWDRKKLTISPSDDSIASLLSPFGVVEHVEFLGKKGNQAMVTFRDASSCRPCVDAFRDSKEMRAKFVGSQKDREDDGGDDDDDDKHDGAREPDGRASSSKASSRGRDAETLEEWRMRQAVERERLLREMQEEGHGGEATTATNSVSNHSSSPTKRQRQHASSNLPFPLPFPDSDHLQGLTSFEKLCALEENILGKLLTTTQLQALKEVSPCTRHSTQRNHSR